MPHLRNVSALAAQDRAAPLAPLSLAVQQAQPDHNGANADQQFVDMLNAYRPNGGLLRAPEAAARCRRGGGTDMPTLAGWIVHRQVVSFEWLSHIWLPVFQFQGREMRRHSGFDEVLSELVAVYDDWQIANWFSRPNQWLADARPADVLAVAAPDVLHAARNTRFCW
jgi:hypothetical protein